MTPRTFDAGFLTVVVACPRCHERQDIGLWLGAKLVVTDEDSALHPVMKSKGVDHKCGQLRLENVVDADPALPLDDDDDERPLDHAERAAGEGVRRS
jgi:hypothetical protein